MGTEWTLFIDESGQTDDRGDTLVVAGLLLEGAPRALEERLRPAVEEIFPLCPWPPHAAHANQPLSRLAWWRAATDAERGRVKWAQACERLDPLVGDLDGVSLRALKAARARVLYSPDLTRLVTAGQDEDRALVSLFSELGAERTACLIAASGPCDPDDIEDLAPLRLRRDRYVQVLETALERLAWLIGRDGALERLHLLVATRHVQLTGLAPRVDLRAQHLRDLWEGALEGNGLVRDDCLHPIGGPPVLHYGPEAPAGVVLADWLANRVRRMLRRHPGSWRKLSRALDTGVLGKLPRGLKPRRSEGPLVLSSLADLEARGVLRETARSRTSPDPSSLPEGWGRTQALAWINALVGGAV